MNNRLPKNQFEGQSNSGIKKNVGFVTRKEIEREDNAVTFKSKSLRKIRSEKSINVLDSRETNMIQISNSKKLIKLPPLEKEPSHGEKKIGSSKKVLFYVI